MEITDEKMPEGNIIRRTETDELIPVDRNIRIISVTSNKCLDSADPGTSLVCKWAGSTGNKRQQWILEPFNLEEQYFRIKSIDSGKYLDSADPGTTLVCKWEKNDSESNPNPRQVWHIKYTIMAKQVGGDIELDYYYGFTISSLDATKKLLDCSDYNTSDISKQSEKPNELGQLWYFEGSSYASTIKQSEIKSLFTKKYGGLPFYTYTTVLNADIRYHTLTTTEVIQIYQQSDLNPAKKKFEWKAEKFDCDDFAICFKADVSKWMYQHEQQVPAGAAFGVMWGTKKKEGHAFNFYITPELDIVLFEPQKGSLINELEWDPYFAML
jgi:hypothetical protein